MKLTATFIKMKTICHEAPVVHQEVFLAFPTQAEELVIQYLYNAGRFNMSEGGKNQRLKIISNSLPGVILYITQFGLDYNISCCSAISLQCKT